MVAQDRQLSEQPSPVALAASPVGEALQHLPPVFEPARPLRSTAPNIGRFGMAVAAMSLASGLNTSRRLASVKSDTQFSL